MPPLAHPTDLLPARIAAAVERIDPVFLNTPQFVSQELSAALEREVVIKNETTTPIGSFKGRGTWLLAERLDPDKTLVCSTAGIFGQGLAYAARAHGATVEAFVSPAVPETKLTSMRAVGARVHEAAQPGQAARDHVAASEQRLLVLDGLWPEMAEGAGTIAHELEACDQIDLAIVQVGDGADLRRRLLAQACAAADSSHWCLRQRRASNGAQLRRRTRRLDHRYGHDRDRDRDLEPILELLVRVLALVDEIVLVDDDDLRSAQQLILETLDIVVEPAGAAGVAALARHGERLHPGRTAILLTGAGTTQSRA